MEDAIYRLGEMAGELLDALYHRADCNEDECTTCATRVDVDYHRLGTTGGFPVEGLHDLTAKIDNLLERVR